jgi:hypothetical protein
MLAFEIHVNGKKVCTAGIGEPGVLTTTVTWVLGDGTGHPKGHEELGMGVGGLVSGRDEYLDWFARRLRRGDEISIRIVEASAADRARRRRRESPAQRRKQQQKYVRCMAKEFGWKIQASK